MERVKQFIAENKALVVVLLGAFAGRYLDQRWGTGPWITLVGTLLGTAVGFYEVVSVLKQLEGKRSGG